MAEPLTVAAAADLSPLTDGLATLYREETGLELRFVLGSSGVLARQVANGAPYDVYLSANSRYVDELAKSGKILPASVRVYAFGRLGVWRKGGAVQQPQDLLAADVKRIAIPNPEHAPYGEAARDFLQRAGVWQAVEPKAVYGENVRQAAQFAATGNVEAVISAWTWIQPMGGTLIPADAHAPIRQAGGVVAASSRGEDARLLLDLLGKKKAQALLRQFGFGLPKPDETR